MIKSRDLAVFGGTFDPVHHGHLIVAEEARTELSLSEVLFVPAGQPWLKARRSVSPARHRMEMLRLAISENRHFRLSSTEVDRPGPSYTVDTVEELRRQVGNEARLFFLMGSDALAELPQWKEPRRLMELCRLAAFARPGRSLPSTGTLESTLPGLSRNLVLLEVSQIDISSTEIRRSAAEGLSLYGLVPPAVENYILEHGLYRKH